MECNHSSNRWILNRAITIKEPEMYYRSLSTLIPNSNHGFKWNIRKSYAGLRIILSSVFFFFFSRKAQNTSYHHLQALPLENWRKSCLESLPFQCDLWPEISSWPMNGYLCLRRLYSRKAVSFFSTLRFAVITNMHASRQKNALNYIIQIDYKSK